MYVVGDETDEYRRRLEAARRRRGLSQRKAAEAAGIHVNTWRNVVAGKHYVAGISGLTRYRTSPETLAKMAVAVREDAREIVELAGLPTEDILELLDSKSVDDGPRVAVVLVRDGTPADEVMEQVRKALEEIRGQKG